MGDRPVYPRVEQAPECAYVRVQLDYKTEERGAAVFGEHRAPGEALLPRVRLPRWLWVELGRPRFLTVTVRPGRQVGVTAPLFGIVGDSD